MGDPAREARHNHVPSTCNTHGLPSLPRVSREPVLAWWALRKESEQGSSEKQSTKITIILVAFDKDHPAPTVTVIVELDVMEEPLPMIPIASPRGQQRQRRSASSPGLSRWVAWLRWGPQMSSLTNTKEGPKLQNSEVWTSQPWEVHLLRLFPLWTSHARDPSLHEPSPGYGPSPNVEFPWPGLLHGPRMPCAFPYNRPFANVNLP